MNSFFNNLSSKPAVVAPIVAPIAPIPLIDDTEIPFKPPFVPAFAGAFTKPDFTGIGQITLPTPAIVPEKLLDPTARPATAADIMGAVPVLTSPNPFSNPIFKTESEQIAEQLPPINPDATAPEVTTYLLKKLSLNLSYATAARPVLAELWRHLKNNPETKDLLLPEDLGAITKALTVITGYKAQEATAKKVTATKKATAKEEKSAVVSNIVAGIFDDMDFG
jgi:hypothetical protein